jgi:hypothetical protein
MIIIIFAITMFTHVVIRNLWILPRTRSELFMGHMRLLDVAIRQ